jgi:hypothetical protein
MSFSTRFAASCALAFALTACSSPNPLGGLAQPQSGADAGSNAATTSNAGGDDDDGPGFQPPTPSPRPPKWTDASTWDDGGGWSSTADDGGAEDAAPEDGSAPTSDSGVSTALLAHCVAELDSYRTQAGGSTLTESSALEGYGALAAASDSQSGTTHGYFAKNQGNGISSAESELPGFPLNQYASLSDLVDQGVQEIFNEGPGAAPYDNLVNATFTQAGCGFATTPDGNEWVTFEYK